MGEGRYTGGMLCCAITDGKTSGFVNTTQVERVQNQVRRWAAQGIDIIQIREKNLDAGALFTLAEAALRTLRDSNSSAKLLINARADVAIAARAHGVHLTGHRDELTPRQVRELFTRAGLPPPVVSVSCHSPAEIAHARHNAADLILFGPIFEKRADGELVSAGMGLEALALACEIAEQIPVLALGGVTPQNAGLCVRAGAAGIAGIRLFL